MCSPATTTCEVTAIDPPDAPTVPSFAELSGQQWLMPCTAPPNPNLCDCEDSTTTVTVGGRTTSTYDVQLRIRGLVERGAYEGGDANGTWYQGGMSSSSFLTVLELRVSVPQQHYFLNNIPPQQQRGLALIDYELTLPIAGGALVTLAMSASDGREVTSATATIPGVTTTPSPYLGQFAQVDVVQVTERP